MATVAAKGETKDIGTRGYVAIAAVMIVTVVGLLTGIVWYNFDKTRALTIMTAERLLAYRHHDCRPRIFDFLAARKP